MKDLSKIRIWILPFVSGVIVGTSFIPFPPWGLLFGFIPLWIFWGSQTNFRNVFIGGLAASFTGTIIGFNWVAYTLHEFAEINWFVSILLMLFYALIANYYVPLAGILWFTGQKIFKWSWNLSIAIMALITALCETNASFLFDFNLGYSWYGSNLPICQWAEYIGFSGLSSVTIMSNLAFYFAWQKRKQVSGKLILASVIVGFIALNIGGYYLKARLSKPDMSLNALIIQSNVTNYKRLEAELGENYRKKIFGKYCEITDYALMIHRNEKIDFAIWGEAAFPYYLGENFKFHELPLSLSRYIQKKKLPIITGAYGYDEPSKLITNSLFAFNKYGKLVLPYYSKNILIPFGEYIPGEEVFPKLREWFPDPYHFKKERGPFLLRLDGFKFGAQICYESLFPRLSRAQAEAGAQFFVNITNDSWYGTWQEPYQHMYIALSRSIEFRRPVLRATNSGISTASLASGEILELSPMSKTWTGLYNVPYLKNPPATFYQQYFYLVPVLLSGILTVLLLKSIIGMILKKS